METFDYDDIQLIPNKCVIKSRKEADPQVKFGPKTFKIPVVPANMASVINEELAVWLAQNDYYYVMHRFNPADRAGFVKRMHDRGLFASISVGIKDSEYDFINQLKDEQLVPEYITIDVAHGHSDFVIAMIKHIKSTYRYGDSSTGYFTKILPIFMGFFVFFFVFLISGIGLLRERSSGTLDRLLATPVRRGEIVTGYMVSYGVVAIVQTLLIVITTVWLLKVQIVGDLALVFLINILLALAALAMGIFISTFASSEFQMMQFVPIVVMPQVFFSGIVPLDALPNWIQVISKILPLTYAGNAMNDVIMKGQGVETIAGDLGVLILFIVFFVVLNVMGLKRYRKV